MFMVFLLVAFFSVIYAIKRLIRKGVTPYARKQFVVKHILYIVVLIISWQILLLNNYVALYNFTNFTKNGNFYGRTSKLDFVSYLFMFGNGILLAGVRIQEPFYKFVIKEIIYESFGIVIPPPKEGLDTQPLNTFLA
jgi:hypothetical protein